jgi:hypothetical protein
MTAEELYALLHREPFQPFRLHLTDGRTFDVRYPEMNLVCWTFFTIGIPEPNVADPYPERVVHLDYDQVRQVEFLAEPSPVPSR